jgi:hypothetical protein
MKSRNSNQPSTFSLPGRILLGPCFVALLLLGTFGCAPMSDNTMDCPQGCAIGAVCQAGVCMPEQAPTPPAPPAGYLDSCNNLCAPGTHCQNGACYANPQPPATEEEEVEEDIVEEEVEVVEEEEDVTDTEEEEEEDVTDTEEEDEEEEEEETPDPWGWLEDMMGGGGGGGGGDDDSTPPTESDVPGTSWNISATYVEVNEKSSGSWDKGSAPDLSVKVSVGTKSYTSSVKSDVYTATFSQSMSVEESKLLSKTVLVKVRDKDGLIHSVLGSCSFSVDAKMLNLVSASGSQTFTLTDCHNNIASLDIRIKQ